MPRKPINYDNACIYQFEKEGVVYYVGSTTNFTHRKAEHKSSCNNERSEKYLYPIYIFIRDNGGWNSFKMILIENFKCSDSNELRAREQHWINEFKPTLMNQVFASRTNKQWQIDNKEDIAIKKAKYQQENREGLQKYKKQYHIENRDKVNANNAKNRESKLGDVEYQTELKSYKAKWYKDNQEKLEIKNAKYYNDNKDTIAIQGAKYREDNKEKIAIQRAKYRAEKLKDVDYQVKLKAYKAKWQKDKQEHLKRIYPVV